MTEHSPSVAETMGDITPIEWTDATWNPGILVQRATESGRPVLLMSRGRGFAVLQSLAQYEAARAELSFLRAVVKGLANAEEGQELTLAEVKARFGPKSLPAPPPRSKPPTP